MKKILTFFSIAATVLACGANSDKSSPKVAQKDHPKIDGEKLYKNYCIVCHGLYGDMGASGAHDLTKSKLTLEERITVITKGRKTMAPFEGLLSEEKIKAVAEHTLKLMKE